jgi:hypothetical protein
MKLRTIATVALVITAFSVTSASAQNPFSRRQTTSDIKTKISVVSYSATATTLLANQASGPCDTSSYAMVCPSGECACAELTGKITGSKIGTGTVQIDVTEDIGLALLAPPEGSCAPMFADALITGSKDDEILFFNGDVCSDFSDNTFGQGGFTLDSSSQFENAIGKVTVSAARTSSTIKWTFKGQAIP